MKTKTQVSTESECIGAPSLEGSAQELPQEVLAVINAFGLTMEECSLLRELAMEAVTKCHSEAEATAWLNDEVRSRYPDLWSLVVKSCSS
jgi:hypothetical protein